MSQSIILYLKRSIIIFEAVDFPQAIPPIKYNNQIYFIKIYLFSLFLIIKIPVNPIIDTFENK